MNEKQFQTFLETFSKAMAEIRTPQSTPSPVQSGSASNMSALIFNFEPYRKEEKFQQYRERFENYASLKGILDDNVLLKKTFLNCVGSELYELTKAINAPATIDSLSYTQIVESLGKYLSPKPNVIIEQHRFLSTVQSEKESIGEFVASLQKFLSTCEFKCSCNQSIADIFLRAQFIRGIRNPAVRERLLQEKDLTFKRAVDIALACESSRLNNQEMSNKSGHEAAVPTSIDIKAVRRQSRSSFQNNHRDRGQHRSKPRSNSKYRQNSKPRLNFKDLGIDDVCVKCGRNNHETKNCRTPSHRLQCKSCNKSGHVDKVCIKSLLKNKKNRDDKSEQSVKTVCENDSSFDYVDLHTYPDLGIHNVTTIDLLSKPNDTDKYFITLSINGVNRRFEVDSGCGYTLLPENEYKKLQLSQPLQPAQFRFRTYDSGIVVPLGVAQVNVKYKNRCFKESLFVVSSQLSPILGRSWIRHLDISLKELDSEAKCGFDVFSVQPMTTEEIVAHFPLVFQQRVGKIPSIKCSLQLRPNARPVFIRPREIPYAIRDIVEKELADLERDGIITPINESDWGSPLVPVPKPDNKIRLCADYKVAVNPQLTESHYPIPRIEHLISLLRNAKCYCKIDLYKAYLHLEVDEESRIIQTISTHKGTYLVNRLSFGIKSAPGIFHAVIERILRDLLGVVAYFDDIIVFGATLEECQQNLLACLQRLQEYNLHVNISKCVFFQTKVTYLGYLIEGQNIRKDPRNIKAIVEVRQPRNQTEVKQFLGLVTYYSKFIPAASTITYPLRRLLTTSSRFSWSPECETAFKRLKSIIASDQVLTAFNESLPVVVACDASPVGIGAVLSHRIDGAEVPVMFASRSLTPAERNYSQIDREALAIVFALDKFHVYIYGRKFTLITDNRPLTRIFHQHAKLPPMTASRLLRYAAYLTAFDYEVKHRPNEQHNNVDFLSRFPLEDEQPSSCQKFLDMEILQCQVETVSCITSISVTSSLIECETKKDPNLRKLLAELRQINNSNTEFTLNGDIVFRGNRVYIPASLRENILNELHSTHSGMTKMKQLARRYCYWPSIDKDIQDLVKKCEQCAIFQKSPAKVPTHKWEQPNENFERVHIDYAGPKYGLYFLILVDARSKWPEVRIIKKAPTSEITINLLDDIFATHGIPQILVSDNASIFTSDEFKSYCECQGIFQLFIAPGHAATNGLAERYVQILKSKLAKMESSTVPVVSKVKSILSQFRATPLQSGDSPAERYLGRQLRLRLDAIKPFKPPKNVLLSTNIREFQIGERVQARTYINNQPGWKFGTVTRRLGRLHYFVKLDGGYTIKRHIDQLHKTNVQTPSDTGNEPSTPAPSAEQKKRVSFDFDTIQIPRSEPTVRPLEPIVTPPQSIPPSSTQPQRNIAQPQVNVQPMSMNSQQRSKRVRQPPVRLRDYVN